MFIHNIDPVLLRIGFFEIRWYGLMYLLSFIFGYFFIVKQCKNFDVDIDKNKVIDWLFYCAIFMIIFSRLIEVIFYNPSYYLSNPSKVIAIWEGGLSFHGGLVGFTVATFIFSKKENISFLKLADLITFPAAIGLMLGRFGNFINGELIGIETTVPWCFKFENFTGCRHPSQLYEAFKNLLIFIILFGVNKKYKHRPDGFIFFLFLILYAVFRSIIEQFFRQPVAYVLGMTQGQFLNIFLLIAGIIGMYFIYRNKNRKKLMN